jgi:Domain of unknown function (DUF4148)
MSQASRARVLKGSNGDVSDGCKTAGRQAQKVHSPLKGTCIMTSKLLASAVFVAAALTSVGASAETFNPYLWDQMKAPTTKTRAAVKAELLQAPKDASVIASPSAYYGAADLQKPDASSAGKAGAATQANARSVKTGGQ